VELFSVFEASLFSPSLFPLIAVRIIQFTATHKY
jgi:hypothetical protein